MEEQSFESREIHIKEQLANSDEYQLLDLTQDILIRLAAILGERKINIRVGETTNCAFKRELKQRIARVAVLMDVLQLRYDDASGEEETFLKDIETCLE